LLGARVGYVLTTPRNNRLEIFGGLDNALDEVYSLGNDLNALGGRYFNTAAPRNVYAGAKFDLSFNR
jgi:iron complex outermembrane recepter protein